MSDLQNLFDQSNSEYLALEQAVRETERGRWFLAEFSARNRRTETAALFASISQLERAITRSSTIIAQVQEKNSLANLADDIEILIHSLSQTDDNDHDPLSDLGNTIAMNAFSLARDVDQARDCLATLPVSLRSEKAVVELEGHFDSIIELMTQQNQLSRKAEALVHIMNHCRARLAHARASEDLAISDVGEIDPLIANGDPTARPPTLSQNITA